MGVDHGGTGGQVPPEFGAGDANTNCPPRFCHIGTKISVLWPLKYAKIAFLAGALPRTPLGELKTLPRPLVSWRGDTPRHMPPHSTRTHLRHSPCVPPEVQTDLRLWVHLQLTPINYARKHFFSP